MLRGSMHKPIILASASPRRKELLGLTGLEFEVDASAYEENLYLKLEPHKLARFLSKEKARTVAGKYKDKIIIAADTFIVFKNKLFGKPRSTAEAKKMLGVLRGLMQLQGMGSVIVRTIDGDYFNVIGLPLFALTESLKKFGISVL